MNRSAPPIWWKSTCFTRDSAFPCSSHCRRRPYYVLVGRAESRPLTDVWSIPLAAPLPAIQAPLSPGDADVPLDLQLALTTVYDLLGYDLAVNYAEPSEVPLPPAEAEWVDQRLRAAGLRGVERMADPAQAMDKVQTLAGASGCRRVHSS